MDASLYFPGDIHFVYAESLSGLFSDLQAAFQKLFGRFHIFRSFFSGDILPIDTDAGREELTRRAAIVHADSIFAYLRRLECPLEQKLRLLDCIIEDTKKKINQEKHPQDPER